MEEDHEQNAIASRCQSCKHSKKGHWGHICQRSRCSANNADRDIAKSMSGLEGKEVVVFLADIPPGGVAARHYHPGDEAIYMLQGSLSFEPDHEQPFELKAGEITFNPAKHTHKAKNTSPSEPAKVLNCMIAEKGQPLAIPVE